MSQRVKIWKPSHGVGWIKYEMSIAGDDIQFTDNFWLHEFVVSKDHPELAEEIIVEPEHIARLDLMSRILLQPARDYVVSTISILSGIRSWALNEAVDGSEDSDHLCGLAADITTGYPASTELIFDYLRKRKLDLIGQLILYRNDKGQAVFVHVSFPSRRHHGEVLYADTG